MRSNLFLSLLLFVAINGLTFSPASNASVIIHSGIGIDGRINSAVGVEWLSKYEEGLYIESLLDSADTGSYFGNQYKLEKNYTNIEMETYRNGDGEDVPVLIGGDYQSKAAFSFENHEAAASFTDKLNHSNFSSTFTNAMLHRPIVVNHVTNVIGLTVEPVEEQTRTIDDGYGNSFFTDNGYGQFAIDYSFSAIMNNVNSFDLMQLLLNKSVNDYLTSFDHSLYSLDGFEQDLSFSTFESSPDEAAIAASYSQRFWFNNETSALKAQNYFEKDIINTTEKLFNSPMLSSFELEQSSLSLQQVTEVPEPSTWVLFSLALVSFSLRNKLPINQ